jgi:hypothetical protein
MRRRELVTLVTVAAIGWPLAARTQQKLKVPIVGIMWNGGGVAEVDTDGAGWSPKGKAFSGPGESHH